MDLVGQLFNRIQAEERVGGVEFWHSPERCGWLTKQGGCRGRPAPARPATAPRRGHRLPAARGPPARPGAPPACLHLPCGPGRPPPLRPPRGRRPRRPRPAEAARATDLTRSPRPRGARGRLRRGVHQDLAAPVVHPEAGEDLLVQEPGGIAELHPPRGDRRVPVPVDQGGGGHHPQKPRIRAVHDGRHHVLPRGLRQGEGGLDQRGGEGHRAPFEQHDGGRCGWLPAAGPRRGGD